MTNPAQQAQSLGQAIWYDNIQRDLLTSGELHHLIELGISGLTSNPTIFEKAISGSTAYDEALMALARAGKSVEEIYEALAMEDIGGAADLLRPVYDRTGGADGYASLEVSPALAHDTDGTVAEAKRLFAALDRPNILVKVPATPEGVPAVRRLIGEGVNVNVTLIFSLAVYRQVMEAYLAGLEDLARAGGDVGKIGSVASFFVSRVDTAVDGLLQERIDWGREELGGLLGKAAVANAKLAYQMFKEAFGGERFASLQAQGARVQRPLWASTSTKNPAYRDVLYVEPLIGPDTVNTMPQATLDAFLEHGVAETTIERDLDEAQRVMRELAEAGIDMEQVTAKLLDDGVKAFADSFDQMMANIAEKRSSLLAREHAGLGVDFPSVDRALAQLQASDVVGRIWDRDHTVWKPEPTEIANRLGWLDLPETMAQQAPSLKAFSEEVRQAGFRHIVLLGMGGSVLGPKVLGDTLGSDSYPQLIVLDTTVPAWVQAATEAIDPARALFLVSSKSGGTVETLSLYKHFRRLVEQRVGKEEVGRHFVAITDAGSSLERLGREQGFRRVFLNPEEVGGRYSVLSYFGLVPAALAGVDVSTLLDRARSMGQECGPSVPVQENPGAGLGATMGALTLEGRDKLTLVTSPSMSVFGLWVEQLIAESTGKEGTGIIPVACEPLVSPAGYGDDRLFVYLRLEGDDNAEADAAVASLQASGQPVIRLDMRDGYDLGAEFFRWEFATAVAGSILGINAFDQPNVQGAKDMTGRLLQQYQADGGFPPIETTGSPKELLSQARPGDYLAIMAYIRQTPDTDRVLAGLRRRVMERYRIAAAMGYGPRYLHSTGQLHKGGPDTGLFLEITSDTEKDLPIPGESYTFDTLACAQALGDLQALQALGRRVVRVHLSGDVVSGLQYLADDIEG